MEQVLTGGKIRDAKLKLEKLKLEYIEKHGWIAYDLYARDVFEPFSHLRFNFPINYIVQFIKKMLTEAERYLQKVLNSQASAEKNYFTVFVVHTGQLQKFQYRNIFKSGNPSELSYIA